MNRLKKLLGVMGLSVIFFLSGTSLADEPIRTIKKSTFLDISPNGKLIASGYRILDINSGEVLHKLQNDKNTAYGIFHPKNSNIYITSGYGSLGSNQIKIWDTKTGIASKELRGSGRVIFHPSGKYIAFKNKSNIILWDIKNNKILNRLSGYSSSLKSMVFSPRGSFLATASYDETIKLWNTKTWKLIKEFKYDYVTNSDVPMVFSPKEDIFAYSSYKEIMLMSMKTGNILHTLKGHKKIVDSLAFNFQSNVLVSEAFADGTKIWNIKSGKLWKTLRGNDAVLMPNGNILATSQFHTIYLWNAISGKFLKSFTHKQNVYKLAFSKKGNFLISTSRGYGSDTKLWNVIPYNYNIANLIYKSIDKSDYIALYEFTKKFYNKFDIVQKAYRDIYKAVSKEDTLDSYEWYESVFKWSIYNDEAIKNHIGGYNWYQKTFDSSSSSELSAIETKLNTLRQKQYSKEYEQVEKENNLVAYEWFANSHYDPKGNDLMNAINSMHQLAFEKAKELNTISAYNTFVFAYPYASQGEEANKRAYELEKEKYTDIGMLGIFGKDEKMNKQVRKLFIKVQNILDTAMHVERSDGYYMVIERMYNLAQAEFSDTDAVLTFLESEKLKSFKRTMQKVQQNKKFNKSKLESDHIEDTVHEGMSLVKFVMAHSSSDIKMKEFYDNERKNTEQFIESVSKKILKETKKRSSEIKEKAYSFEELYQKVVTEYKPEPVKVENVDLGSFTTQDAIAENQEITQNSVSVTSSLETQQFGEVYRLDPGGDGFLSIRVKPKGREVGRLYNGSKVEILGQKGKWYRVKDIYSGKVGWSHGNWIRVKSNNKQYSSTKANKMRGIVRGLDRGGDGFLSIRVKPKGREVGRLYNGSKVEILGQKGKWYRVKDIRSGKMGWSYGKWIKIQ